MDHKMDMEHFVGFPIEMKTDKFGLYIKSKLNLDKPLGQSLYSDYKFLMENDQEVHHSIGYVVTDRDQKDSSIIKELKLYEYSTVSIGANQKALAQEVKSELPSNLLKFDELVNNEVLIDLLGKNILSNEDILLKIIESDSFVSKVTNSYNTLRSDILAKEKANINTQLDDFLNTISKK